MRTIHINVVKREKNSELVHCKHPLQRQTTPMKTYNEYVFSEALKIAKWEEDYEIIGDFMWVRSRFLQPHGATKIRKFFRHLIFLPDWVNVRNIKERDYI